MLNASPTADLNDALAQLQDHIGLVALLALGAIAFGLVNSLWNELIERQKLQQESKDRLRTLKADGIAHRRLFLEQERSDRRC